MSSDQTTAGSRRRVFGLGALLVAASVVTALAAFTDPPVDEWLYLQARGSAAPQVLAWFDAALSAPVLVALCLLLLLGWRCRALVGLAAAALAAGVVLAWALGVLVARPRPYDSAVRGGDSYPSPGVLVLALLAVLLPVALDVLTRSRAVRGASAAVLWLVTAAAAAAEVQGALRWPLDELGAAVLGSGLAVAALVVLDRQSAHRRCTGCPWQQRPPEARPETVPAPAGGWRTRVQHPLYRIALVWTVVMVLVLGWLALTRGIPRSPQSGVMGTGLEVPLHVGLLGLLLAGVLLAARWHVAGAVVVALAATLLGYASSVEYAPWVAVLLTVAGFVPALLLWVQWHRVASPRAALTLAALTSALLVGLVYLAATNYTYYWGPTHPTSATPAPDDDVVEWMWSGAVTPTSVTVRARTAGDAARVRLAVSTRPTLDAARYSPARPSRAADDNIVSLTVSGLAPGRDHYYALEVDGVLDTARVGRVTTFPRGPASFTFAVAGDSRTGSNGQVYDAVRRTDPLFYLNVGDFFYGDVDRNDRALYLRQYQANLTAPAQAALYAQAPIAYIWGDHDFASNDADSTAPGRPASLAVYRQVVPHYALPSGRQAPIFQAFTVGDVRFVLTDNRSRRDPPGEAARSMLGRAQLRMLQRELDGADRYGLLVWANADPWVDRADPTTDTWGGFAVERRRISMMIAASDVRNLLAVSGDAHMLAYDDGSHTDYSGTGRAGFPLFQAAALDRKPSVKGGPYTGPVIPGGGQFGLVHVHDDGRTVRVSMDGMNWRGERLFRRTFTVTRGGS